MNTSDHHGDTDEGSSAPPAESGTQYEPGPWPEHFEAPDGTVHTIRPWQFPATERFNADLIALAQPKIFERCPICLTPGPTEREHIPPESVGGTVMTRTCERCNQGAGSRLEADLTDWFSDRFATRFTNDALPGSRRGPRIQLLETENAEPVFFFEGDRFDQAVLDMLGQSDVVNVEFTAPNQHRALLAALKSAYLAACLICQAIPQTPEANAIRAAILAGIATPRRRSVPMDHVAHGLWFARNTGPAVPGEVALAQVTTEAHPEPRFAISLARTLLVGWPIGGNLVGLDQLDNPAFVRPM